MREHGTRSPRRGFTLVELLVVILIIGLVSVLVIPTVYSALNHRQVSEAARILQAGLVGARDTAINNGAPAGIRLLPDPTTNDVNPATGALDPTRILASNRFIPIQLAPDYSEGLVSADTNLVNLAAAFAAAGILNPLTRFPYPPQKGGGFYPATAPQMLYLEQAVYNFATTPPTLNAPTSWYWNVRIGDKIQINNSGILYTVVGPMDILNPELFVNVGPPGSPPVLQRTALVGNTTYTWNPEILFLVNGQDDNNDGFVDNGWDGIDNDLDGIIDRAPDFSIQNVYEWTETENWQSSLLAGNITGLPYTITRRPVVSPGAKETALPSNVVVDLTTWNAAYFNATYSQTTGVTYVPERSRLPVDPTSGSVDILLNPNGTVLPTTEYSNPSSFGMDSAFYHFWLAERGDLYAPPIPPANGVHYLLPQVPNVDTAPGDLRALSGERLLLTLYTRTGQIITNAVETFDGLAPGLPFLEPQQGVRGDTR
jgi:prepilin-type N-terminal cleavage/methylation domain-containing protein